MIIARCEETPSPGGDPNKEYLIEPNWLIKKFTVLNDIDKEMVRRDTYQGIKATTLK